MKFFWGVIVLFLTTQGYATDFQSVEVGIGTIQSEKDLISVLTQIQQDFQGISPPSTDVFITKTDVPYKVDWSGFSKKTTKYMTAYMDEYGLPRYPLLLWEDASTRDKVISLASTGYELARIAPTKDYVPESYYTSLLSKGIAYCEFTRWIFDPAHTAIEIELIPASLYSAYEQNEAMTVASAEPMLMSMESIPALPDSGTTNITGTASASTNSPYVEIVFNLPESFGGHAEIFRNRNLLSGEWDVAVNRMAVSGGAEVAWTDYSSSNQPVGYYILSDASFSTDSDADGYSDLREHYTTTNDPFSFDYFDVDQDGMHDWYEMTLFGDLSQTGTNDFDLDGLENGLEMTLYPASGTNSGYVVLLADPTGSDTDGDGVDDGTEYYQGSDPSDETDEGEAPPTVLVSISVFGESIYKLSISSPGVSLDVNNGQTEIFNAIRGKSYPLSYTPVQVVYMPDGIEGMHAFELTGKGIVVEGPASLYLNNNLNSMYFGYGSAVLHAIRAEFEVQPDMINYGFDPTGTQTWASVVVNNTNPVSQLIATPVFPDLQVDLVPEDDTLLSVNPDKATVKTTPFKLKGLAEGVTALQAQVNGQTINKLNVHIFEQQNLTVGIYRVYDSRSHSAADITGPSASLIETTMNKIFKQCGVQFSVTDCGSTNIWYDDNTNGICERWLEDTGWVDEMDFLSGLNCSKHINLIFMNQSGYPYENDPSFMTRGFKLDHGTVGYHGAVLFLNGPYGLRAGLFCAMAAAHETGHILGLHAPNAGHDSGPVPEGTSALMKSGEPVDGVLPTSLDGWIRQEDWLKANETAKEISDEN